MPRRETEAWRCSPPPLPHSTDGPGGPPWERPQRHLLRTDPHSSEPAQPGKWTPARPSFTAVCSLRKAGLCLTSQVSSPPQPSASLGDNCCCADSPSRGHKALTHQCPLPPRCGASAQCSPFQRRLDLSPCFWTQDDCGRPLPATPKSAVTFPQTHCAPEIGCH